MMLPEDRLDEAIKQLETVRADEDLTDTEQRWLNDAGRNLAAVQRAISNHRAGQEDAEVVD